MSKTMKTEILDRTDWIQTFSGRKLFPLKPTIDQIVLEDIAHALSNICRFGGHTRHFWSVASHSLLVSSFLEDYGPTVALWGLMHDSAEYGLGDMVSPLKRQPEMQNFVLAEENFLDVVGKRFFLPPIKECWDIVEVADKKALVTEAKFFLDNCHWIEKYEEKPDTLFNPSPEPNHKVKKNFIARFGELQRMRIKNGEMVFPKKESISPEERTDMILERWGNMLSRLGDE